MREYTNSAMRHYTLKVRKSDDNYGLLASVWLYFVYTAVRPQKIFHFGHFYILVRPGVDLEMELARANFQLSRASGQWICQPLNSAL